MEDLYLNFYNINPNKPSWYFFYQGMKIPCVLLLWRVVFEAGQVEISMVLLFLPYPTVCRMRWDFETFQGLFTLQLWKSNSPSPCCCVGCILFCFSIVHLLVCNVSWRLWFILCYQCRDSSFHLYVDVFLYRDGYAWKQRRIPFKFHKPLS